jgi:hypothetical protein
MTRFGGEVDPEPWPGCNSINTTLDKTKVLTHRNSRNLGKNEGQIRAVPLAPNTNRGPQWKKLLYLMTGVPCFLFLGKVTPLHTESAGSSDLLWM